MAQSSRLRWHKLTWLGLPLLCVLVWAFTVLSCSPEPQTEANPSESAGEFIVSGEQPADTTEMATEIQTEQAPETVTAPEPDTTETSTEYIPSETVAESVTDSHDASESTSTEHLQDAGEVTHESSTATEHPPEEQTETPGESQGECVNGTVRNCYPGSAQTRNVGICRDGQQACIQGKWDVCRNAILPQTEICDGKDNDCNGTLDENCCSSFQHSQSVFAFDSDVADIAFTPDGQIMAVASQDAFVRVWRLSDNRLLARYEFVSAKPARSVDWGADNKTLVASGEGDYFRLIELGASTFKYTFRGHVSYVTKVRLSPDGKMIASGGADSTVRLWDTSTGQELRTWKYHTQPVSSISFSPDNKFVVSSSDDKQIAIWSVSADKPVQTINAHTDIVTDVSYSPDGKTIASSSFDKDIRLWNPADGKLVKTLSGHKTYVLGLSFSPDSKTLASIAFQERPSLWKIPDGTWLRQLSLFGQGLDVGVIRYHPHGRMVATGGKDGNVRLWNLSTDQLVSQGYGAEIADISVHPTLPLVALARDNRLIDIYNLQTGKRVHTLTGHTSYVRTLFFSKDGKYLISGGYGGWLYWWNTSDWSTVRNTYASSPATAIRWLEPSWDGKTFASISDDRRVRIWDTATGQTLQLIGTDQTARKTTLYSVAIHYKNDWVATGASSTDPVIRIWSRKTNTIVQYLQGHRSSVYSLSFAPNSDVLASAGSSDRTIRLWDAANGTAIRTLFLGNTGENMWTVQFSPNGKWLAAFAEYGTVYVWDTQTYQMVGQLKISAEYALAMKWSPYSQSILAATRDGFLHIWKSNTQICSP